MGRFHLRAGIHFGHAIAVTMNDRLDYFGTTINMAARLQAQSVGGDLVVSAAVFGDEEVPAPAIAAVSALAATTMGDPNSLQMEVTCQATN